jgi:signal transduction histidine kinase
MSELIEQIDQLLSEAPRKKTTRKVSKKIRRKGARPSPPDTQHEIEAVEDDIEELLSELKDAIRRMPNPAPTVQSGSARIAQSLQDIDRDVKAVTLILRDCKRAVSQLKKLDREF